MDRTMKKAEDSKIIPMTSVSGGKGRAVRDDVYYYTNQIVNVVMVGNPGDNSWVLIDAGMPGSAKELRQEAEGRYGKENPPAAIILTHGHFDHVGSLVDLLSVWEVPVYAHPLEHDYLTGRESYPEPDRTVEGGKLLAKIATIYPHKPIDIAPVLRALPDDHSLPGMPGWRWIHTPGHSRGHVSLYRERDSTLIAGDAFVTVRQDSLYKVLMQKTEVNGPPNYLTTDWDAAWDSVRRLAELRPELAVCGHGSAMAGEELTEGLRKLADAFEEVIPKHGKFVDNE